MAQEFYICQGSELPILQMELIQDGRSNYRKIHEAIQSADITFSMINVNNGTYKISNAPAYIKRRENSTCVDEYLICYNWKKRDTNEIGMYKGIFSINFNENLKSDETMYDYGELIVPIREDLIINIK